MKSLTCLCLILAHLQPALAQTTGIRTYANPIDLDYKYNFEQLNQGISYRSGADPVIVTHRNEYYLFQTVSGGYWRSTDLVHWNFIVPSRWPFEDVVAPAALTVRDTVYLMQSMFEPRPILATADPASGRLEFYNRLIRRLPGMQQPNTPAPGPPGSVPPGPWDPAIFHDAESDRWYLYWGSSNYYPLYGIELDKSKRLTFIGEPRPLLSLQPELHGWERFGRDHRDTITPYIEGAWMTKHAGRYYLQYGAPGTEYNVYANGTYVGDSPLGPFHYAAYNPVSYRPGGFFTGAGHGNTFQDIHGNYWNTGTGWVGVNWNFERRIVMYPAGFDPDGQMFANTRFGDFPHRVPDGRWTDADSLFTGWMLLSYRKAASASSVHDSFPASYVTDENPRTFWVAGANRAGEQLTIDLGRVLEVKAVQVNYTDYRSNIFASDSSVYTRFKLHHSVDGVAWSPLADLSRETRDRPNPYIELPASVKTRFIRYGHLYTKGPWLAISDLRVFGNRPGRPPPPPEGLRAQRDRDPRNVFIKWNPVRGAVGYNIRWGIHPEKLYQTYQVFSDQALPLEIRALTIGQEYYFAIETFDEVGVSGLSRTVHID
jgi:hypothetical protein